MLLSPVARICTDPVEGASVGVVILKESALLPPFCSILRVLSEPVTVDVLALVPIELPPPEPGGIL